MDRYKIPKYILAEMIGINRLTLFRLLKNQHKANKKTARKIIEFHASWKFEKGVWHREPFLEEDLSIYKISKTGYIYGKKKIIKNDLSREEYLEKHDYFTTRRFVVSKNIAAAMSFHKDKPILPKYDAWFTCIKCNFRVLGKVRHRLATPPCPICGNYVRPCLGCTHYEDCDNQKDCFYRKRNVGTRCRNCGMILAGSKECACGYLNDWRPDFKKMNESMGYSV